jgi:tetratricopeptide (TPR) repeat protein
MTSETEKQPARSFVACWWPWLLAAGMLVVYLATLNHWISAGNFSQVVYTGDYTWRPNLFGPVTFLLTYPAKWLPPASLPLALNVIAAICAVLTLAQLARSVALLPHDRTHEQREKEGNEHSLLSIRSAWVPPLMAVLVCGLQMTFWENAVEGSGEMIDLLIFSYVIRCLLEYRIDQKESRLVRFALVYGAGMANHWAMMGFFPVFLTALIWIKGIRFFNARFMLRMAGCILAGFSLILLLPLLAILTHKTNVHFGPALHFLFTNYKNVFLNFPKGLVLLLSLTSLLPLLVISFKWSSYFGDSSPLGIWLTTTIFHVVHALFLLACLWVTLDPPFSPRHKAYLPYGIPFLTFYYLGALGIGYFSGYFLLVFGAKPIKSRARASSFKQLINSTVTGTVWLLLFAVPFLLIYKNLPSILANRTAEFARYSALLTESLPAQGGIVMSDDTLRLYLLEAYLDKIGKEKDFLLIDSGTLGTDPEYYKYLDRKHPQFKLGSLQANSSTPSLDSFSLIHVFTELAKHHELFYMHSSFGYYFEQFYLKPRGLLYQMILYGDKGPLLPPPPNENEIRQNQEFWKKVESAELSPLIKVIQPPEPNLKPGFMDRIMLRAHLEKEPDRRAGSLGAFYAQALNDWGVQLQRAGRIKEAAVNFDLAAKLNPDNAAAQVNLKFNEDLQTGGKLVISSPKAMEDKLGKRRGLVEILKQDGTIDDPGFCNELGSIFAQGQLYREAAQQFDRVHDLLPDELGPGLLLTQTYVFLARYFDAMQNPTRSTDCYSNASFIADQVLQKRPDEASALFLKGISLMQLKSYDHAILTLDHLLSVQTNNYAALLNRGIAYLQTGKLDAARQDYEIVAKAAPKAWQAYYGLAEIAYRNKETPVAIKNYQLYLTNAPPNTEEVKLVQTRLKELGTAPP